MESFLAVVVFLSTTTVAFAVGYGCIRAIRWATAAWPPFGYALAFGILIRLWAGLALYVISFWNLPILRSLQLGDGFWFLALDARTYFFGAAQAAGGAPIPPGSPSPSFVGALAWWLWVAGRVPVTAVLFNLALYVASCAMVIAVLRPTAGYGRRATLIVVASLSFSPVLILLGTQPLKDVFSAFLIVMAAAGVAVVLTRQQTGHGPWQTVLMVAAIALAIFLMAGVRPYYALFMWAAVALALVAAIPLAPHRMKIRSAGFALVMLAILWLAFMRGAGPYYVPYGNLITRTIGVRLPVISPGADSVAVVPDVEPGFGAAGESMIALRQGFVRSGGATNLEAGNSRGAAVLTGLAALFVPITVLRSLSIVEFSGGRGFIAITDLDTLFVDATLIAVLWVVATSGWSTRRQLPYMLFALGLGLVTALLMAYIVTNYGTLFRLRLLATVPLWLVPLAFRRPAPSGDLSPTSVTAGGKNASASPDNVPATSGAT
jgi:hypothetical protein